MNVELAAVKALREARSSRDDWTGLTDPAERRRRQNRLHQRAWRRRQAEKTTASSSKPAGVENAQCQRIASPGSASVDALKAAVEDGQSGLEEYLAVSRQLPVVPLERLRPFSYWEELKGRSRSFHPTGELHRPRQSSSVLDQGLNSDDAPRHFPPVFTYLNKDHGDTTLPQIFFPLSPDHRLLVLIQLNVFRAMLTNMSMLRLLERLPMECGMVLYGKDFPPPPEVLPPSLQETWLQRTTPHDMWLDIVPCPKLRDNILVYESMIDEDEFCVDIMGGLYEGFNDIELTGLLVWGEPWSETGWEITQGFAKKWDFLLEGCDTLIEATNKYRAARGEDRLVVEM